MNKNSEFRYFLTDCRNLLQDMERNISHIKHSGENIENVCAKKKSAHHLFRIFHTLKGVAAHCKIETIYHISEKAEILIDNIIVSEKSRIDEYIELVIIAKDVIEETVEEMLKNNSYENKYVNIIHSVLHNAVDEINQREGSMLKRNTKRENSIPEERDYAACLGSENFKRECLLSSYILLNEIDMLIMKLLEYKDDERIIDDLYRNIHSLKGRYLYAGLSDAVELLHEIERIMYNIKEGEIIWTGGTANVFINVIYAVRTLSEEVIAVGNGKIDRKDYYLKEISRILQNQPSQIMMPLNKEAEKRSRSEKYGKKDTVKSGESLFSVCDLFHKVFSFAEDTAASLGKSVDFYCKESDVYIDCTYKQQLIDSLMHIVKNAVDHGIESSEERKHVGKRPRGSIVAYAEKSGSWILISIEDDGCGIDLREIKKHAEKKGILSNIGFEKEEDSYQLIFYPGFSTKACADNISGRGVGLDAARRSIEICGGAIQVESTPGNGTRFILRIPVSD